MDACFFQACFFQCFFNQFSVFHSCGPPGAHFPEDALVVLQHCGLAVRQERRAMQVALRSGPVKAVPRPFYGHLIGGRMVMCENYGDFEWWFIGI